MILTIKESGANPSVHQIAVQLEEDPESTLKISIGDFTIGGDNYSLPDPWTYEVADSTEYRIIIGFLAMTESGLAVVVDEHTMDDPPIDWGSLGYSPKRKLFSLRLEAGRPLSEAKGKVYVTKVKDPKNPFGVK